MDDMNGISLVDMHDTFIQRKIDELLKVDDINVNKIITDIQYRIEDLNDPLLYDDEDEIEQNKIKFVNNLQENFKLIGIKVNENDELATFFSVYKPAEESGITKEKEVLLYYLAYYIALMGGRMRNLVDTYNKFGPGRNNVKRRVHPVTTDVKDDGIKKGDVSVKQSLLKRCVGCFTRRGGKGITKLRKRHRRSKHRKQKACHRKSLCKRRMS
jgi:hypothetical protein